MMGPVFIGHFGVAFAGKRWAPAASLGTLFLACQLADLLWPDLVLLGVERFQVRPGFTAVTPLEFTHYPWSHSLLMLSVWGVLLSGLWLLVRRGPWTAALVLAATVLSHWVLDVVTHVPDMPLAFGDARLGLGLWRSVPLTLLVEVPLFVVGAAVYARSTEPRDRTGRWALVGLIAFLAIVHAANLLGPPPPSVSAVAWSAQAMWLLVAWAYWVDRHRTVRERAAHG
jgi:hypothetical protein